MRGWGAFVAVVCCSVLAFVAPGAAGARPQSSVTGTGTGHFMETGGPFELSVSARGEGPLAQGYVFGSGDYVGEFQVDGPVTCMLVVGNRASIKYRFRHASRPGAPPQNGVPVDRVATEPPQPPATFDAAAGSARTPR
jgi:hypothetical protein